MSWNNAVLSNKYIFRKLSNLFNFRFTYRQEKLHNMSRPKRYFVNNLQDYQGGSINVPEGHWKSQIFQTVNIVEDGQPPQLKDADGGLYVGAGGIGYMFFRLSQMAAFKNEEKELLNHASNYIKAATNYADSHKSDVSQKSAFLLGNAGSYAVAAAFYNATGDKQKAEQHLASYIEAAANCKPVNFLRRGGDELFIGRAGYVCGALWLEKMFGRPVIPPAHIHEICSSIVQSGRTYAQRYRSPCPLMFAYYEVEYLGAAHGLCAILQMLLSVPKFLHSDAKVESDIKESVDYLLSLQTPSGNFPCALDEIGSHSRPETDELVHWCHGAPGVVYLMAKAYLVWKEDKYLKSCLKSADLVWSKGLLKKGPGICHGIAGSGYVFLLLYRLTGDPKYLHRASAFAEYMFKPEFRQGARTPDCPNSLYEGLAGTVCFLADMLHPEEASFPFLDVF